MTRSEILKAIQDKFPDVEAKEDELNVESIIVPSDHLVDIARFLKSEPSIDMDYNMTITAADWLERVDVIYYFMSYTLQHIVALKVQLPNDGLRVKTISDLWASADWFEREVYDLFGVVFEGHPDLRRIMLPADWEGHPLRKGFQHPNLVHLPENTNPATHTGMGHHTI